jgi:hypothetical protein
MLIGGKISSTSKEELDEIEMGVEGREPGRELGRKGLRQLEELWFESADDEDKIWREGLTVEKKGMWDECTRDGSARVGGIVGWCLARARFDRRFWTLMSLWGLFPLHTDCEEMKWITERKKNQTCLEFIGEYWNLIRIDNGEQFAHLCTHTCTSP